MKGQINEESPATQPERKSATTPRRSGGTARRKVPKRTYPWSLAEAVPLPRRRRLGKKKDKDMQLAKTPRLRVPFPATGEETSSDAAEAIPPLDPGADSMTAMQPNARATRSLPSVSTLETDIVLTREVKPTDQQRTHNRHKEYRNEWPEVAAMAPVPTNMQLISELRGWHPSIYQTTGFTGMSTVDQVKVLQILNGMNGHASPVARGLGQPTGPCPNGWSPRDSAWHHAIALATGLTGLTGIRTTDLVNILETQRNGNNLYASTVPRDLGQTTSPYWNGWSPRGSAWDSTIAQATDLAGLTGIRTADQGNILETQQNGKNWYTRTVPRGLGQTTSPFSNGWTPRDSAWYPTIAQAMSLPGMRTADQGSILETQQNGKNGYANLALDPRQTTTRPCRKRLYRTMDTPVDTPVDGTTGRTGRWTTEEVEIDWTTERKGKWTAEEDEMLLRAAEKFAVTRWKTIAALIPGRTKKQCWNRWQYALDPSIARITERTGKWSTEEDDQLVGAAEKHNGKNWDAIATLVPSRTKRQCMDRWHKCRSWSPACTED
jgi:hypothetical protein